MILPGRLGFRHSSCTVAMLGLGGVVIKALRILVPWFFIMAGALQLSAAIHPVPLEPNTDPKTCIECHEDQAKGKFVHSAIAMGCTTCHEVRSNKGVTRIKLTTSTPQALCLTCHADMNAATLKGTVHPPAVRDCLKCHNPHQSDYKYQLLKPTSGDKGQNLCLECHTQGLNVPEKGSRHAALDMGCDTCHVPHKVGERGKEEFDYHLTKASPALCLDCHDPTSADLQKAHNGQPFATANCVQCHNPHQSNQAHLMQKFTHAPFEAGACDTCHQPAKDGKVVLTQSEPKAICVTCHAEQAEKIEKAKVQHPGAQGDCTTCHNPHAGKTPGFIQPNPGGRLSYLSFRTGRAVPESAFASACVQAELCHLPRAARRRQRSPPAGQQHRRTMPGVSWPRLEAASG